MSLTIAEARRVLARIASAYGVTVDALLERNRMRPLPEARQAFALTMHARGYSLRDIGSVFGMHHTWARKAMRCSPEQARHIAQMLIAEQKGKAA